MKCRIPVALALAGGYVLGRTKKMKLALMVAGMAAGSRLPLSPGELARRGADVLQSSEEVGKLVDLARNELVDAGKAAITSAASNSIEGLSDRLAERTAKLGSGADDEEDDEEDEEQAAAADSAEEEAEESRVPRTSTARRARSSDRSGSNGGGRRRNTRTKQGARNG